ncbi:hypothetical protein FRX31_029582, partial [Thalictrum thalictroides]
STRRSNWIINYLSQIEPWKNIRRIIPMAFCFPLAGIPPGHDIPNHFPYDDDHVRSEAIKDTHLSSISL